MPTYDNLCMNCMHELPDSTKQCTNCGFLNGSPQLAPYLPVRTIIAGRYLIGKLLENNGDGATYMGWDIERKAPITIREFLPDAIATRADEKTELEIMPGCEISYRDCLQSFLDLWRKLARMRGLSALILVIDIVEDNNTAYAISEYMEGVTLREYLLSSPTGYLSWSDTRALFMPVLSTLATLHSAGIIHRGISPTTLIIGKDKKMRISGFSIWQARASWSDLNSELFSGYAAIEQYGFEGQQGPWTDIYAFSAVLYRTLIGSTPIEATTRVTNDKMMVPGKFAEQLPAYVINALINALQILPEDRTRTVDQFRAELSASPSLTINDTGYIEAHNTANIKPRTNEPKKPVPNSKEALSKQAKKKSTSVSVGVKAALIVLCVGTIIFAILCMTVLKDNFVGNNKSDITTSSENEEMVIVPTLVNQPYSIVSNGRAFTTNFTFVKKEVYSDTVKAGNIISQDIAPDKKVRIGTQIELVVSLGTEQIKFVDVSGKPYDEANQILTELGFKCSKVD
ncbi:MAG: PASTA domain-containing protein, partial [Oscillospiraceae bacterium]